MPGKRKASLKNIAKEIKKLSKNPHVRGLVSEGRKKLKKSKKGAKLVRQADRAHNVIRAAIKADNEFRSRN